MAIGDLTLLGPSTRSAARIAAWLKTKNVAAKYLELPAIFIAMGNKYGVRGDIAVMQSCLETGWFWNNGTHFDVDPAQNNFAGLGTTGNGVAGDSFATPAIGIEAQIQDLALRADVKIAKEDCLSAYVRKVYSTIANYHFTKWAQLAGSWAADTNYWVKICSIINDFDTWNAKQGEEPTVPTDYSDVTWHNAHIIIDEKTRQMEIGLASYAGGTLRALGRFSVDSGLLSAYLSKFPNAQNIVKAEPTKAWPTSIPTDPVKPPPVTGKKVLLDIGHSLKNAGASSNNGVVKEYALNKYAIECMQKVLISKGIQADIYDPDPDNLTGVGQRAWQYDAAISFHHNSYDGSSNPYHCIMIDPSAPNSWKQYTSKMCIAMAKALDSTVADTKIMAGGTNGIDGVYEAELSVLNASAKDPDAKPPYHCLVEAYFLNPMNNVSACMEASKKAAEAIALFLSENPWP